MTLTASVTRHGVEFEITFEKPDAVSVSPSIEVELLATPLELMYARQDALRIEAEVERALHRAQYDRAAGFEDWRVMPGSNRHVRLAIESVGARIVLDFLDDDDALDAMLAEFERELRA